MSGWPLKRIVVAGGGTAGWMAAAAIARTLGRAVDLTLVESDAIGTVGVGESTIPPLVAYNRILGINEAEFMRATQATFKLGIQFDNWLEEGKSYFHSFGLTGKDHWSAGFQHFWLAARERGLAGHYGDYCLELKAADAQKFAHLPEDRLAYAYQLDATLYAKYPAANGRGRGHASGVEGKIADVELDGESGNIAALLLESGERIEGRPVRRLHGVPRAADRGRAGAPDSTTGPIGCRAIPRSRCRPARVGPPRAVHAGHRRMPRVGNGASRCSIASATASSFAASSSNEEPRSNG